MIYAIAEMVYPENIGNTLDGFRLYEPYTKSSFDCSVDKMQKLLKNDATQFKNISIKNGKICLHKWPNGVPLNNDIFIIETKCSDVWIKYNTDELDKFEVVNLAGELYTYTFKDFCTLMKEDGIANCTYNYDTKKIDYVDVFTYTRHCSFETEIEKKYKNFIMKTAAIGLDLRFRYIIENDNVIITSYEGSARDIVLPNFVNIIDRGAFDYTNITNIKFGKALKYIGNKAFKSCQMPQIEIPATVKFIGTEAFGKTKIICKSDKTIVADELLND